MSLWQFVLPRNRVTLFAGDTLGLGIPLERESQPLSHSVSWAKEGVILHPSLWLKQLLSELLLVKTFVRGVRV